MLDSTDQVNDVSDGYVRVLLDIHGSNIRKLLNNDCQDSIYQLGILIWDLIDDPRLREE